MQFGSTHEAGAIKIRGDRDKHEKKKFPIPSRVKQAASDNQQTVLPAVIQENIEAVDNNKKAEEIEAVK
ncbi:MAG: hypothetical protein HQL23_03745 [Candidatus Omnitrophica bacterium]|nr:hypothetical protein [Candidatus Omnitrophota bacterium]